MTQPDPESTGPADVVGEAVTEPLFVGTGPWRG